MSTQLICWIHFRLRPLVVASVLCPLYGCGISDSRATPVAGTNHSIVNYDRTEKAPLQFLVADHSLSDSSVTSLGEIGSLVAKQPIQFNGTLTGELDGVAMIHVQFFTTVGDLRAVSQDSGFVRLHPKPGSPGTFEYSIPCKAPQSVGENEVEVSLTVFPKSIHDKNLDANAIIRPVANGRVKIGAPPDPEKQ